MERKVEENFIKEVTSELAFERWISICLRDKEKRVFNFTVSGEA